MINVDDKVEISGIVSATGTDSLTVTLNEIYLDSRWLKFSPAKELVVNTADYDTELTSQELELVKALAEANKESKMLTPDQQVLALSIIAKLGA